MHRLKGFTLIELLVAMAIMALIGLLSWQVLSTVIRARELSGIHLQRLENLQRALQLIRTDVRQAVQRPVSDSMGGVLSPLQSVVQASAVSGMELTRTGMMNPMHQLRSRLQRVRYEWRGTQLHRLSWTYLDQAPGTQPEDLLLLDGVHDFRLRYLDSSYQWQVLWPEPMDLQKKPADQPLPMAIDLSFRTEDTGQLRILLVLPAGLGSSNGI